MRPLIERYLTKAGKLCDLKSLAKETVDFAVSLSQ